MTSRWARQLLTMSTSQQGRNYLGLNYVEGTFTPTISAATPPTGVTYTARTGQYVKIGNLVHVCMSVQINSLGSSGSGAIWVGGLPYPADLTVTVVNGPHVCVTDGIDIAASCVGISAFINGASSGASSFGIYQTTDNATGAYVQWSALATGDTIYATLNYIAA